MTKQKIPVWLDCDTGNDDAFAILLSAFHPRVNLLGISTVHGNAPLAWTTHNTLGILDILHVYNVKVYPGEEAPLVNEARFALDIHGKTGIGGIQLPQSPTNRPVTHPSYLDAMHHAIMQHQDQICLVSTGTSTNIARLITKYPHVVDKIKYISVMGGSFGMGNASPFAEFNFHTDPHASKLVMAKLQDKMILTSLNLSHKIVADEHVRRSIYSELDQSKNSQLRRGFYEILMFYSNKYGCGDGEFKGPPLHDPIAVYSLLPVVDDDFAAYGYKCVKRKLDVVLEGDRMGASVVVNEELELDEDEDGGVIIGQDLDKQKFWKAILDALHAAE
ncbi:uncharacterized protein LODBEIA_P25640 [Lodderomyces beijingensis]|uniref:Inosine/uridine-preferring nucleoside hydrolase domain-containing protein n=1 Tax=Lodderomyces beijingensis TaxID=1775926 RepID=A0ABP0ZQ61_9ASCO